MVSAQKTAWIAAVSVLFPLSAAAVVLRVHAARVHGIGMKWPDYLVQGAFVLEIGFVISLSVLGFGLGAYGQHIEVLPSDKVMYSFKATFVAEWFWACNIALFRLSIVLFYVEIFPNKTFRHLAMGTIGLVIAYFMVCILVIALLCRPIEYNWNLELHGECGNYVAANFFSAVFNILIDVWVVFLPLPLIWKLQLSAQKKGVLTACFSLGLCTAAINLGRFIQTLRCPEHDQTHCALDRSILVLAEMSCGILVASVPKLGLLVRKKQSKTSSSEQIPPVDPAYRGHVSTIGSASSRPRRGDFAKIDPEGSLLYSQNDMGGEWIPLETPATTLNEDSGTRATYNWRTDVGGGQQSSPSTRDHWTGHEDRPFPARVVM